MHSCFPYRNVKEAVSVEIKLCSKLILITALSLMTYKIYICFQVSYNVQATHPETKINISSWNPNYPTPNWKMDELALYKMCN